MRRRGRSDNLVYIEIPITPKQKRYLDELVLLKRKPRTLIVREIIEEHRLKHK